MQVHARQPHFGQPARGGLVAGFHTVDTDPQHEGHLVEKHCADGANLPLVTQPVAQERGLREGAAVVEGREIEGDDPLTREGIRYAMQEMTYIKCVVM